MAYNGNIWKLLEIYGISGVFGTYKIIDPGSLQHLPFTKSGAQVAHIAYTCIHYYKTSQNIAYKIKDSGSLQCIQLQN